MLTPQNRLKNFAIGAGMSSILSATFFLTSMYSTHTSLSQMGSIRVGLAIALPLLCGIGAALWGDRFLESLAQLMENSSL